MNLWMRDQMLGFRAHKKHSLCLLKYLSDYHKWSQLGLEGREEAKLTMAEQFELFAGGIEGITLGGSKQEKGTKLKGDSTNKFYKQQMRLSPWQNKDATQDQESFLQTTFHPSRFMPPNSWEQLEHNSLRQINTQYHAKYRFANVTVSSSLQKQNHFRKTVPLRSQNKSQLTQQVNNKYLAQEQNKNVNSLHKKQKMQKKTMSIHCVTVKTFRSPVSTPKPHILSFILADSSKSIFKKLEKRIKILKINKSFNSSMRYFEPKPLKELRKNKKKPNRYFQKEFVQSNLLKSKIQIPATQAKKRNKLFEIQPAEKQQNNYGYKTMSNFLYFNRNCF